MHKSQINPVALAATVAAVGILLVFAATGNRGFGYETTIGGLSLLFVLFGFEEEGDRPAMQGLAFAAVAGMCVMVAAVFPITLVMAPKSPEQWAASIWLAATLLFFAVDRMRASSRETSAVSFGAAPTMRAAAYVPPPVAYSPPPPPVAYAPPPPPPPAPVYRAPAPVVLAPVMAAPVMAAPESAATATAQMYVEPEPPAEMQELPAPQYEPVAIAPPAPGRETVIFLNLLGEGLNVLRSVRAEHLGRDYYRIAETMPPNERWEYEPNSVVRARKKALSNGKHLVAFEEAPRAQ